MLVADYYKDGLRRLKGEKLDVVELSANIFLLTANATRELEVGQIAGSWHDEGSVGLGVVS